MTNRLASIALLTIALAACQGASFSPPVDSTPDPRLGTATPTPGGPTVTPTPFIGVAQLPSINAAITVLCTNENNCNVGTTATPAPVANFQMSGCNLGPNDASCDSANLTLPWFIDGYNVPPPNCAENMKGTSTKFWGCDDTGPKEIDPSGVYGVEYGLGASVFFHQAPYSTTNLSAIPRGKKGPLSTNADIDAGLWDSVATTIADMPTAKRYPVMGKLTYTLSELNNAWGTALEPKIIVISSSTMTFTAADNNDHLEGWGILLIDHSQVTFTRNFRFNGLVIIRGPESRVNFYSSSSSYGESYVFGGVVLIDTLPDTFNCASSSAPFSCVKGTPSLSTNRHGLLMTLDTTPKFPRFRYSLDAYNLAAAAYNGS